MTTTIRVPLALCVPPRKGGSQTLFEMRTDAVSLGIATRRNGDHQLYEGITDYGFFPVSDMLSLRSAGCVIEGYPLTVQLDDAALALDVPEGLPARDGVDENGDPRVNTWGDLSYTTHQKAADGSPMVRHYIDNSAVCNDDHYTSEQIGIISAFVTATANAALLSDAEVGAIQDANLTEV